MPRHTANTNRLEAFSDGVIAVIITIMVLELKVPSQDGLAGLYTLLPILAVYLLSFTLTGIYWINHHHLIHRITEADAPILYANLLFLFSLSLMPFFTSYVLEKKMDFLSVAVYIVSMIVTGLTFMGLRRAISRHLRQTGKLEAEDTAVEHKHWLSLLIYLLALYTSWYHPRVALSMVALITVLWITPTVGIKPRSSSEDSLR